jgi:hypothetical protein
VGPQITVPRAGDYITDWGARYYGGAANTNGSMSLAVGAAAATDTLGCWLHPSLSLASVNGSKSWIFSGVAAGTTFTAKYRLAGAYSADFVDRFLRMTPVRVA